MINSQDSHQLHHNPNPLNSNPQTSHDQSKKDVFSFLLQKEQKSSSPSPFFSENGLSQDIIQVTQAEPDVCLEVFYALYHLLWPQIKSQSDISLKEAWTKFIGGSTTKGSLCPPEKLITEKRIRDIKSSLGTQEGETKFFEHLDQVISSISFLKEKIDDRYGQILHKKEIMASLTLVQEFYQNYRNKIKELVQAILEKEKKKTSYTSESNALEDLLEPKAVMMSDVFTHHWAYRISRTQAQKLLSLDMYGRNLKNNINDRVISFPEKAPEPLVFFKANGNPPIQPEKEFMVYSLYRHLQIPVPETALLVLTDVFEANPEYFYAVQASEAVLGESALKASSDPETIFDQEAYVSQVIGSLLTNPSNSSFKNFKYSPEYKTLISINNDITFQPEFTVKSILYLLPQIDLPIPESVQTFFTTLDPQLTIYAWLQDLSQKNKEYQLLFTRLAFQKTRCIYQNLLPQSEMPSLAASLQTKIHIDPDLHNDSFYPQILLSKGLLTRLKEKLQVIEKTLLANRSVSTQALFEEISPVLGKYYRKLRFEFSDLKEAEEALWGVDNSYISSILDPEELADLLSNQTELEEENLLPEVFLKEYKEKGQSGLDGFIRRQNQRKKKNSLNPQLALKELQLLVQEGLTDSQSIREVVDFSYSLSRIMNHHHHLIKEITSLLSNLPHPELKWLLALEKLFLRPDRHIPKNLSTSSVEVNGAFMKKRTFLLAEDEKQYLFDQQGNIKKNIYLTGRSLVTCFPEKNPQFYLKQYPEFPGYEFASTLFMRLLGVSHLPYQDLIIINSRYPVLLTQKADGEPVLRVWNDPKAFNDLDPFHTTLLIISAMLINPEDGKEDNFILSPDRKYLIPIDNDHCFLPSTFQKEGTFWNLFTVNTALQTKTLLFCLDEMNKAIPPEVRQHIISLDFDSLLTKWMTELDSIENKLNNLVGQQQRNEFLEKGTVMRIPFYKQFIQSIHWKAHKIQDILRGGASEITPFDLLKTIEPFAARCYQNSFQQGDNLQGRFKAATNNLYAKTAIDGSRMSILNTRAMMEIINVSMEDLQNDVMFQKMGPVDALELLNQLIQEYSVKAQLEQEMLFELDEKKQEKSWASLFGSPPSEAALKAFFANPKEGLILKGSKLIVNAKLTELFAQANHPGTIIRFLSLPESPLLTDKEIRILAEECCNIEYLNLSGCLKLNQFITKEREWPLLARLEAKDCSSLTKFVSYSPIKILQIGTDQEIEIFVEKSSFDIFTISKRKLDFEFSVQKGVKLEIKSQGQMLSNDDFFLRAIRGKEEVERYFRNFQVNLQIPLILSGKILEVFPTVIDLKKSNIKTEDIQKMVLLNLRNLALFHGKILILRLQRNQNLLKKELNLSLNSKLPLLNRVYELKVRDAIWGFFPHFNHGKGLNKLDLSHNEIKSFSHLIQGNWPKLNHLDLSFNEIVDKEIQVLAQGNWPLLETLNLQSTNLTVTGIEIIVNQSKWPQLRHLNLSDNFQIDDKALQILSQAANWPRLKALNLNKSQITKKKFLCFILNINWPYLKEVSFDSFSENTATNLISKNWHLLEKLDLSNSEITLNEIELIVKNCHWPHLKQLNLSNNLEIDGKALQILSQANWPLLQSLNLKNLQISKKDFLHFILDPKWSNLKEVSLDSLKDDDAKKLLPKNWQWLEEMNLSKSEITRTEVEIIVNKCKWSRLKNLDFSSNEISDGELQILIQANWPFLEVLDLSQTKITAVGVEILTQGNWPLLEKLSLRGTQITLAGVRTIVSKHIWPKLKHLDLSDNKINDETFAVLCQGNWFSLETLAVEGTEITTKALASILLNENWPNCKSISLPKDWNYAHRLMAERFIKKDLSQLEELDLNFLGITLAEIEAFKCPQLTSLKTCENDISFDSKILMIECPLLEELHLENTKLSLKGIEAIASQWLHLKHLNVSHNKISDEGILKLAFAKWPLLEILNLSNTKLSQEGIEKILSQSKWQRLKYLDVSQNEILDGGLLALALADWPEIEEINLENTKITSLGIEIFLEKIKMPNLKKLNISQNQELRKEFASESRLLVMTTFDINWQGSKEISLSKNPYKPIENIFLIPHAKWDQVESLKLSFNQNKPIQSINHKVYDLFKKLIVDKKKFENSFFEACPLLENPQSITKENLNGVLTIFNCSHLKKLDLSLNPIGDEGFEILASLNWPLLEDLSLKRTNITIKSIEILINNRPSWPHLKRIDVAQNLIHDEGLEMITSSNWTELEYLNLEKTEITEKGIEILTSKEYWPNLKGLSLSRNEIGNEGLKTLCSGKWPLLEKLYLRETKITGKGIECITNIWPSLKILDLSDNQIFTEGSRVLSEGKWPLLECLNLKNTGISQRDIQDLFPRCLLNWSSLKEIHFQGLNQKEVPTLAASQATILRKCPNAKVIIS